MSPLPTRIQSVLRWMRAESNPSRLSARLFWVGFALRVAYITLAHTYRIKPLENHFKFGFEAGRIAWALVSGYGYADPFANVFLRHSGPTAWLPPAYPLLLAAVFKCCGVFTPLSAWVIFTLQSALSASMAVATWELGARFAGRRCGLWAGWIWALYPAAMQYAVGWVWEMTLTAFLFLWVLVLTARMKNEPHRHTLRRWLLFGLIWGAIALSNSTLLSFLPVCALWILLGQPRAALIRSGSHAMAGALLCLAMVAPWTVRNWQVFHTFIPLRGNLGAEMYLGNGPGARGFLMEYNHPFQSVQQLRLYAAMGEVNYVKMRGAAANAFIRSDRPRFLRNVLLRIYFFWISVPHPSDLGWKPPLLESVRILNFAAISLCGLFGLALALYRRMPFAGLWAWAFLLLPIPYYAVTVHARFRHPLEPLITILAVYLFQSAELPSAKRRNSVLSQS